MLAKGPAHPAPVKPRQSSPVVVDLCQSPLQPPRAAAAGDEPQAAAGNADSVGELEMMEVSHVPAKGLQPVSARAGSAALNQAKGKAANGSGHDSCLSRAHCSCLSQAVLLLAKPRVCF